MIKFALRVVLIALLFVYAFPEVAPGVQLHGTLWPAGIATSFFFSLTGIIVALFAGWLVLLLSGAFVFLTAGIGLLVVNLFAGTLFAALQLQLLAWMAPGHLTVANWESTWIAAFCISVAYMVFNSLTASARK
ncbi:hypothetical protein BH11CYA1_BH11CYA1_15370 [soil metagenome]